jgi:ATP-binding cassette subfamily B protein
VGIGLATADLTGRGVADLPGRDVPRRAAAIVVPQLVSGSLTAFGLLAITAALDGLLSGGPTPVRLAAAVAGLLLIVAAYALRGTLDAGASPAPARVVPAVRRVAGERLFAGGLRVDVAAGARATSLRRSTAA